MASDAPLHPREPDPLSGDEHFAFGPTVLDFWRWALGDLRMNTIRGFLAEFMVAEAVSSPARFRVEWAAFDVLGADGTRIEVKASGYLQSWSQRRTSVPSYTFKSVASDSVWNEELATYDPVDPADRVDVWVFALQTCRDHDKYNPLAVDQWDFRVVAHRELLASGQRSAGLPFFDRLRIEPVSWRQLEDAVSASRTRNERLG